MSTRRNYAINDITNWFPLSKTRLIGRIMQDLLCEGIINRVDFETYSINQ